MIDTRTIPTIAELILDQARSTPDAGAVISSGRTLSYGEVSAEAGRIATALAARGVRAGSIVGVCIERGAHLVPGLLGVLWAGGAYMPIDPAYPPQRIRLMLSDARPPVILASREHAGVFEGFAPEVVDVEDLPGVRLPPPAPPSGPEDPAYLLFTSGSTGRPKGVVVPQRGLSNVLRSTMRTVGAGAQDRVLALTTVSFDIAAVELLMPLVAGATIILASRDETLDGRLLAGLMDRHGATLMQATPATYRMLVDSGWNGRKGLRGIIGGEALQRPLADAILDRIDALWNMYGPTETAVYSTQHRVVRDTGPVPIGGPVANTTLRVLDEKLRPAKEGELCIGGMGLALGYLGREDLTRERFIDDPEAPGERLYRTGDLVRWRPDGELDYIGRMDHQVKVRGHRVELGDVEAALAGAPAVREVVAGVRREGETATLVAYATLRRGASLTLAELRRHASERVPAYMLPTALVVLEQIPRSPAGKVDRAALAAMDARACVAPHAPVAMPMDAGDDLELVLIEVFRHVLGVEQIGRRDNFFDLGGHSLLAFRAAQEAQERTGRAVDVALLFKHPTVAGLAATLRRRGGMAVPATTIDLQPQGDKPPLFCVCGVAVYLPLARALAPDQPACAIYVDADIDVFHTDRTSGAPLTIEAIADRYVDQIRARRPEGPYRLLGFSMGGAVAYEVARRLIDAGQQVDLVAMVDTVLAHSVRIKPVAFAEHIAGRIAARGPGWAVRRALETLTGRAEPPDQEASESDRQHAMIERRASAILGAYRPAPCEVDVLLFNAADRPRVAYRRYDETGGWGSVVRKNLSIRMIPGDHTDLLAHPTVAAAIADDIRQHLRSIDEHDARQLSPRSAAL